MDRLKLIAEIRKRPALWDFQNEKHKSRSSVPEMWRDVANNMGPNVTVDECKRKWKYLRDAYSAEVKRIEKRIVRDIMKGNLEANHEYDSKWECYEAMKFIEGIQRPRRKKIMAKFTRNSKDSYSNKNEYDAGHYNDMEIANLEPELELNSDGIYTLADDDDISDLYNEQLLTENQKLPDCKMKSLSQQQMPVQSGHIKRKPEPTTDTDTSCKCSKLKTEQIHFLQNLEKEEENLIKSTRLDLSRSNDMAHVGDSDYNFLVSFLPQMKTMNELQNLKFRAKISELMFNMRSTGMSANNSHVCSTMNVG